MFVIKPFKIIALDFNSTILHLEKYSKVEMVSL